jgi:hypothetical protein
MESNCEGKKYDSGKIKIGMVFNYFADAIEAVAKVATYGNKKYALNFWDDNWKKVENAEPRYTDAFFRHFLEHHKGNLVDEESGEPHLALAAWNIMAILQMQQEGEFQEAEEEPARYMRMNHEPSIEVGKILPPYRGMWSGDVYS